MRYFGRRTEDYYERARKVLFSTTVNDYRPVIKKADGVWVEDVDGNKFLDFTSQVGKTSTGHRPEEIVSAICEQTKHLIGIITNDFQFSCKHNAGSLFGEEVSPVKLAEELIRLTPVPHPKKVLFDVSGATAVNAAGKICLAAKPKRGWFGAFRLAFHGRHGFSLDISGSKAIHKLLHREGFHVLRFPFPARAVPFENYKKEFFNTLSGYEDALAAIFIEIVQGEGGINIPDIKSFNMIRREIEKIAAVFAVDEIQTGLGRCGKMFASEFLNVPPDMIVLSKALGAGLPIGAVVSRCDILPNGNLPSGAHSGTMPADPFAVAAALANLHLIEDSCLVKNSEEMGRYLLEGLHRVAGNNPAILDIDSFGGLMIRVEMASKEMTERTICACLSQDPGLLLIEAGAKTIRFMPPLNVSKAEIDSALSIFEEALKTLG